MSRNEHWYVFSQQAGGEFDCVGWSRTKEAAQARVEKLDPMGGRSDGDQPTAFKVYAKGRADARKLAAELFGVKVAGYISPEDKKLGRAIVKGAVMRTIFCPFTDVVLDMRRAVVVEADGKSFVMTGDHWDQKRAGVEAAVKARGCDLKVYDGRELFKR